MKQLFGRLALAAFLTVIAGIPAAVHAEDTTGVESHPWIGKTAPGFNLKETAGTSISLEDLRGKYIVLHFGASW